MRRTHPVLGFVLALLFALVPVTTAGAATEHEGGSAKLDETFVDSVPCAGDYVIHVVANATEHTTANQNGFWSTFTETGTFETQGGATVLARDDEDNVTDWEPREAVNYSGHFTIWGGFNANRNAANSTFTFSGHGTGEDGTVIRFNSVSHWNVVGDLDTGVIKAAFDRLACR